jgi:hypothetical protein
MCAAARTRLQLLANRTGGRLHEISVSIKRRHLRTSCGRLADPRHRLPSCESGVHDGKWREIRVEVGRGELVASTKPGYYAR